MRIKSADYHEGMMDAFTHAALVSDPLQGDTQETRACNKLLEVMKDHFMKCSRIHANAKRISLETNR